MSVLRDTEQSFRAAELAGEPLVMARAASKRAEWLLSDRPSKTEQAGLVQSIAGNIESMFEAALAIAGDNDDLVESIQLTRRQSLAGGALSGRNFGNLTGSGKLKRRRVYAARGIELVATVRRNTPFVHVFSTLSDVGIPIYVQPLHPEQGRNYPASLEVTSLHNSTVEATAERFSDSQSLICRDQQAHGRLLCFVPPAAGRLLRLMVQTQTPQVDLYIFIGDREEQVISRESKSQ